MAKRLEFDIVTDASKGIAGLKQFSSAAKKAMGDVEDSLDGTTTAAQKVAKALSGLADELEGQMKQAAVAADALGKALGPELASRANVDSVVQDLHKMGLTFDEITADADALAGSLKKLDGVQMAGATRGLQEIEDSTKRAKGGVDDIGKSADSSKGALANMIGNTAQDVGALGGVAGSTGVAVGQMAEYFADAALEGESLTAVAGNFAKVALPILAIGGAIATFQQALGSLHADEEQAVKITEDLGQAFKDTGDFTQAATKVLRDHSAEFANYTNRITSLGEAIDATVVGKGLSKLPVIGHNFIQTSIDVEEALGRVGLSMDDLAQTTEGNVLFNDKFNQTLADGVKTGKLSEQEYKDLNDAVHSFQIEVKKAKDEQAKLNLTARKFHDIAEAIALQKAPLQHFTDLWDALFQAIKRGDDAGAAALSNTLAGLLHIPDPATVAGMAIDELGAKADAFSQSIGDAATGLEEWGKSTETAVLATGDMQIALDDMAGTFPTMTRSLDAIGAAFALKDAPLKVAGEVRDISLAIGDLSEDMKGIKVGDVLAGSVKADKFLDAMDKLRPDIQAKIAETFADPAGGAAAATQLANTYITQIVKELGGRFTREQVAKMLGLDDLTATIKIAIDQKSLAEATTILELFANLPNTDPALVMQLQMDLSAGLITPDGVKELLDPILAKAGVTIPPKLLPPDPQSLATAKASADNFYARNPALIATETTDPNNMGNTLNAAQRELNRHPLTISTVFSPAVFGLHDAGGTTGRGGGIVGERRPEIVNGRYLVTSPTIVPPGTRVTSGARTARILRTRGTRGLRKYDSGGTVTGARTVNVNINAGVVGNRYDVMKAVQRAHLDKLRLFGERG